MKKEIDISSRYKDYTCKATICQLPATDEQIAAALAFLSYVSERPDVSFLLPSDYPLRSGGAY